MPDGAQASAVRQWLRRRPPRIVEGALYLHVFALFVPVGTGFGNTGLWLATLLTLIAADAGFWRRLLRDPVVLALLGLFAWLLAASFQAADAAASADEVRKILLGPSLVAACAVFALSEPAARARFLLLLGLAAAAVVALNLAQYARELHELGRLPDDIHLHRHYADPMLLYLPFCLALASCGGRWRHFWWVVVALLALLLAGTGARGAWLAAVVGALAWIAFRRERRALVWLGATAAAVAALGWALLPPTLFEAKLQAGLDTSNRTTGTWLPALEMIAERPLTGFGYGKKIFHAEFDLRAPQRNHWTIKKSIGPHNIFLEAGFAGGWPAILLLGGLVSLLLYRGARLLARIDDERDKRLCIAALCALIAFYLVRGMVESVRWGPLGVLLAALLPLLLAYRLPDSRPERAVPGPAG